MADSLVARGFRTIAIDLPGHGQTPPSRGDYSLGALASLQRDTLDALEIDRCIMVGHSLGGGVALQFGYQYPERLAGLGLLSAGGLGRETSRALRALALPGSGLVMQAGFNQKTTSSLAWIASKWKGERPGILRESSLARWRELADPEHRAAMLTLIREVIDHNGQRISAIPRLEAMSHVPIHIVWGENDHILPVQHGYAAHAALPQSRFTVIGGAGHDPHLDSPETVADILSALVNTR